MTQIGSLEVIAGPMFSGKTEELIRRIKRAAIANKNIQVFKHKLDQRYKKRKVASHDGRTYKSHAVSNASEILLKINKKTEIVAIDEAMWFGIDLLKVVRQILVTGKKVIITGLSTTFTAEPFDPIPSLMAIADKVDKLTAVCNICGKDAIFHKKIGDYQKNPLEITAKHLGHGSKYEARCRNCFTKP